MKSAVTARAVIRRAIVPSCVAVALALLAPEPAAALPTGPDRDGDGIADVDDLCPSAPEDRDGFEDEDGCPDPDNDHDGVPDVSDRCPNDPETSNGRDDGDGCPD